MRVRRDIAAMNGGGWSPALEWFARGVGRLRSRPLSQRTSWRYLAAMHGIDPKGWLAAKIIAAGDPLPPRAEQDDLWNQCQHQSWYFLPWHRGYVAAFEAIVAQAIVELGGPMDWALPYWNYLDATNPRSRHMPQPFLDPALPDGSPNPLALADRKGAVVLGPQSWIPVDVTLNALTYHRFTTAPRAQGFGGVQTAFNHFGSQSGALEADPHNLVHLMVGGPSSTTGFMKNPDYAALDPIFWVHHCNIDRMWAAWLTRGSNVQESSAAWSAGPVQRAFKAPDPQGALVVFTPGQTLPGQPLAPTYDDLTAGIFPGAAPASVTSTGSGMGSRTSAEPPTSPELVGANTDLVRVGASPASTFVTMQPQPARPAAVGARPRYFLNLEHVRGGAPSGALDVRISLAPEGARPAGVEERSAGVVALFGLAKASRADDPHGGNGLSFSLDITDQLERLSRSAAVEPDRVRVRIVPADGASDDAPITVDRVSIYAEHS